ncbi:MAG: hypothetical protein K2Y29_00160 [Beijerinckiaceae bacterium]|nr:hypothetical protein [Beijerinckiaceae bacterium]
MIFLKKLALASIVAGVFAPAAAMAQCVTQGNLVCGSGNAATSSANVLAARGGNFTPAARIVAGDQIIVRDGQGSVQIGACTVQLNANALTSIVAQGNSLCVSNSAPVGGANPGTTTIGQAGMGTTLIVGGVGLAAIAGVAVLATQDNNSARLSP